MVPSSALIPLRLAPGGIKHCSFSEPFWQDRTWPASWACDPHRMHRAPHPARPHRCCLETCNNFIFDLVFGSEVWGENRVCSSGLEPWLICCPTFFWLLACPPDMFSGTHFPDPWHPKTHPVSLILAIRSQRGPGCRCREGLSWACVPCKVSGGAW